MELALIFLLELGGLALGSALARAAFSAPSTPQVGRVVAALERAARAFLLRALTRFGAFFGALLGLLLATGVAAGHAAAALAGAAGMALGAVLAMATAFAATWLGGRAIRAAVARAGAELDLVLTTGLRSAGATGIAAQALGVLGALGLLGVGYWFHHGDAAASTGEIARRSALSLPGYAVGTALVALWLHVTCGAYATSARAGELRGELLDAGVARHITQNPALVASLVGERLEHGALAARLFGATALATVASVWLALGSGTSEAAELRFVAFPLLLWAFGLVGNGAGLFVARALEAQGALPALVRGQACAAGVWLVGLLGAGYWLYPESWLLWFLPGAAGFVGGATAASATARAFARRRGALRDALDGLAVGAFAPQAAAFGFGLALAAFVLVLMGGVALVAQTAGTASGVPGGARLALSLALFAAMAWSPYALAIDAAAGLLETARAVAQMAGAPGETAGRLQRVADSIKLPSAVGHGALTLAQGLAALAAALTLTPPPAPGTETNSDGWATLFGVGLVLFAAGWAVRRSARAARELAVEVERQLGRPTPESPAEDRVPSYRTCEELAGRLGIGGAASGAASVLLGPVLLGIALRLVYRDAGPRLAAGTLAAFVAGAAVTALGVALAVDGARAVLAGARRANRPEGDPVTHAASVTGSALAEILGSAVEPAACIAAAIAASFALLARTFFL